MTKRRIAQGNTPEERFWSNVNKDGPKMPHMGTKCWEWRGYTGKNGYGQLTVNWIHWTTHRYVWFLVYNQEPTLWILHYCDNRKCVNPKHLYEGTVQDNNRDRTERNPMRGENHPNVKITMDIVKQIREAFHSGQRLKQIIKMTGLSASHIKAIKQKRIWKWVE